MFYTPIIRLGGGEMRRDNYEMLYLSTMHKTRQAAGDTDDLSDTLTRGGTMNKTSGRGNTTISGGLSTQHGNKLIHS